MKKLLVTLLLVSSLASCVIVKPGRKRGHRHHRHITTVILRK